MCCVAAPLSGCAIVQVGTARPPKKIDLGYIDNNLLLNSGNIALKPGKCPAR